MATRWVFAEFLNSMVKHWMYWPPMLRTNIWIASTQVICRNVGALVSNIVCNLHGPNLIKSGISLQTNTSPSSCACGCWFSHLPYVSFRPLHYAIDAIRADPPGRYTKTNVAINGGLVSHSRWGLAWPYGANARQGKQRMGCYRVDNKNKTIRYPTTQFCCEICNATWVASDNFGVVSAEQLAKQFSQVTKTKTWLTPQERDGGHIRP